MTKSEFLVRFVPGRPAGTRDRAQAALADIIRAAVAEVLSALKAIVDAFEEEMDDELAIDERRALQVARAAIRARGEGTT